METDNSNESENPGRKPPDRYFTSFENQDIKRNVISDELLKLLIGQFRLGKYSIHGYRHWRKVHIIGEALGRMEGGNQGIIEAFAFLHDSQRFDDGNDFEHGKRAEFFIDEIRHLLPALDNEEISILKLACAGHTDGGNAPGDFSIACCWDADRLDLLRAGIVPERKFLCTETAKSREFFHWAVRLLE